jgi:hypothetical protein
MVVGRRMNSFPPWLDQVAVIPRGRLSQRFPLALKQSRPEGSAFSSLVLRATVRAKVNIMRNARKNCNDGRQFFVSKAGWKGRGLWATYSSYLPKFTETRLGSLDHIEVRPNPLAK